MADGKTIFSTNMNHPLNQLSFEDQKFMIALTMSQFREFPLCGNGYGYDEEELRFYDGVLGNLIRMRDSLKERDKLNTLDEVTAFTNQWAYQGDIYRVLDKKFVYYKDENKEPYLRTPTIKWHGMVASWSKSYDFTKNFNHIYPEAEYTIIHANTGNSAGIDVNKFSLCLGCYNDRCACENEVIFPMKKEYVVNIYKNITPAEFKKIMEERNG